MNAVTEIKLDTPKMIARKEAGIGWIIFNNPERRNALSAAHRSAVVLSIHFEEGADRYTHRRILEETHQTGQSSLIPPLPSRNELQDQSATDYLPRLRSHFQTTSRHGVMKLAVPGSVLAMS